MTSLYIFIFLPWLWHIVSRRRTSFKCVVFPWGTHTTESISLHLRLSFRSSNAINIPRHGHQNILTSTKNINNKISKCVYNSSKGVLPGGGHSNSFHSFFKSICVSKQAPLFFPNFPYNSKRNLRAYDLFIILQGTKYLNLQRFKICICFKINGNEGNVQGYKNIPFLWSP